MGCFSVRKELKSLEDSSPSVIQSFLEDNHSALPPVRWIAEENYGPLAASPSFKARARPIQSVSRFLKNQLPVQSAPSSLAGTQNVVEEDYSEHYPEPFISHSAPTLVGSLSETGVREALKDFRHSGPVPATTGGADSSFPSLKSPTNKVLFPLPLPPDDLSSQSVSSSGSMNSSSPSASSSGTGPTPTSQLALGSKVLSSSSDPPPVEPAISPAFIPLQGSNYVCQPMPLPPPPDSGTVLREFSLEELAGACQNFSPDFWIRDGGAGPVYRAIVQDHSNEEMTMEVAVTRLVGHVPHNLKKWIAEVNSLARLVNPNLCRVVGFCAGEFGNIEQTTAKFQRDRLLVFENAPKGSLDSLLYGRMDGAPLDWSTRLRIALGAAQGLAYLHERTPKKILYRSLKTLNIQVDKNFNAKLSDFGFARSIAMLPVDDKSADDPYLAPEILTPNHFSAESNVWSFGVVLLELLTGRQHLDDLFPEEERNLIQWAKPYLMDAKRIYLVMDPELKGRYPTKSAKLVADLALRCLQEDPSMRPSMREAVDLLRTVPNSKFSNPGLVIDPFKRKSRSLNSVQQGSPGRRFPFEAHKIGISGEMTLETPVSPARVTLASLSPSRSSAATVG